MSARVVFVLALLALLATPVAEAQVRRDGAWPSDEERVTLSASGVSRAEAIQLLADKAGWSIVAHGLGKDTVDLRVKRQPAAQVLSLILADGSYVARRDGDMISVAPSGDAVPVGSKRCDDDEEPRRQQVPTPPEPPVPPPPPGMPGSHGADGREAEDRVVTANNMTLGVSEVVANLTVVAGNVDVYGTITEDLTVFAGNVVLHSGAHVRGDVNSVAGNVEIEEGVRVDGEISGVATQIDRTDDANHDAQRAASVDDDHDDEEQERDPDGLWARLERAGNAVARSALLFAFGAVLLAIASRRFLRLEGEIAMRPLRSFAMGALGLFIGLFTIVVTAVTIVGIPLALAAVLVGVVAGYIGMCAALTALGRALLKHKSPSAYLHLALGCALYLIASSLPGVGWMVTLTVVLIGIGALVSTRGGDLFARRPRHALATSAGAADDAEGSDPSGR